MLVLILLAAVLVKGAGDLEAESQEDTPLQELSFACKFLSELKTETFKTLFEWEKKPKKQWLAGDTYDVLTEVRTELKKLPPRLAIKLISLPQEKLGQVHAFLKALLPISEMLFSAGNELLDLLHTTEYVLPELTQIRKCFKSLKPKSFFSSSPYDYLDSCKTQKSSP
eukprot:GEMP01085214.1.p1 GENE.GEMP01085214.1~~GEMP01085214.1.p1  ORF type:complete len:168 (-),score=22.90 GEMP01085214.1:376-879(-)